MPQESGAGEGKVAILRGTLDLMVLQTLEALVPSPASVSPAGSSR